jgi:hypothetical protein
VFNKSSEKRQIKYLNRRREMKTTKRFKNGVIGAILVLMLAMLAPLGAAVSIRRAEASGLSAAPVIYWSTEVRKAIVPAGPGGVFGTENYGNKFPGEAAVYMGIAHVAIYDTALAFGGGYQPYAIGLIAPAGASTEAAIATVAHHTLIGLQPELGLNPAQQSILDGRYNSYMAAIPDGTAKTDGTAVGQQVAAAVLALRVNDGRGANPVYGQPPFVPPPAGPGVWDPGNAPVVGLRLPGMRPLALQRGSQFRPDGPNALTSEEYAEDFAQVKDLGRLDSTSRTVGQTTQALFWTDQDLRQWNDGMLNLASERGLDLMDTARMLAMAHVSGGDAMIGCFDAKYHHWFWRPYQAIPRADTDENPATEADPTWRPLRATPNFPEYPSAHACHTTALSEGLQAFFGTDRVSFTLDSRITSTIRQYDRFKDVVMDVNEARVLAGFHFRNSDQEGSNLGRNVSRYVVDNFFQPVR